MGRVLISEQDEASAETRFRGRHPVLTYLFGDMLRGLFLVACLALDLFVPAQARLSFPGQDPVVVPTSVATIIVLAYGEIRLYRRLWPPRRRATREVVEDEES